MSAKSGPVGSASSDIAFTIWLTCAGVQAGITGTTPPLEGTTPALEGTTPALPARQRIEQSVRLDSVCALLLHAVKHGPHFGRVAIACFAASELAVPALIAALTATIVFMSHAASGGDTTHSVKHAIVSGDPPVKHLMIQSLQAGFDPIRSWVNFAVSPAPEPRASIVAASQPLVTAAETGSGSGKEFTGTG